LFLAASYTQQFLTDATVLVVAHRTPRYAVWCVGARGVCGVRGAVRCFGSRGAVFRDAGGLRGAQCVQCGVS